MNKGKKKKKKKNERRETMKRKLLKKRKRGGKKRENLRNVDEDLLVDVAYELGLGLEALVPGLLEDGAAGAPHRLVHHLHLVEADVLVEAVLERRRHVVRVVVVVVVAVASVVVASPWPSYSSWHWCDIAFIYLLLSVAARRLRLRVEFLVDAMRCDVTGILVPGAWFRCVVVGSGEF